MVSVEEYIKESRESIESGKGTIATTISRLPKFAKSRLISDSIETLPTRKKTKAARKKLVGELREIETQERKFEEEVAKKAPEYAKPTYKQRAYEIVKSEIQERIKAVENNINKYKERIKELRKKIEEGRLDKESKKDIKKDIRDYEDRIDIAEAKLMGYQESLRGKIEDVIKKFYSGYADRLANYYENRTREQKEARDKSRKAYEELIKTSPFAPVFKEYEKKYRGIRWDKPEAVKSILKFEYVKKYGIDKALERGIIKPEEVETIREYPHKEMAEREKQLSKMQEDLLKLQEKSKIDIKKESIPSKIWSGVKKVYSTIVGAGTAGILTPQIGEVSDKNLLEWEKAFAKGGREDKEKFLGKLLFYKTSGATIGETIKRAGKRGWTTQDIINKRNKFIDFTIRLNNKIKPYEKNIEDLSSKINELNKKIEDVSPESLEYNKLINEYNRYVDSYNYNVNAIKSVLNANNIKYSEKDNKLVIDDERIKLAAKEIKSGWKRLVEAGMPKTAALGLYGTAFVGKELAEYYTLSKLLSKGLGLVGKVATKATKGTKIPEITTKISKLAKKAPKTVKAAGKVTTTGLKYGVPLTLSGLYAKGLAEEEYRRSKDIAAAVTVGAAAALGMLGGYGLARLEAVKARSAKELEKLRKRALKIDKFLSKRELENRKYLENLVKGAGKREKIKAEYLRRLAKIDEKLRISKTPSALYGGVIEDYRGRKIFVGGAFRDITSKGVGISYKDIMKNKDLKVIFKKPLTNLEKELVAKGLAKNIKEARNLIKQFQFTVQGLEFAPFETSRLLRVGAKGEIFGLKKLPKVEFKPTKLFSVEGKVISKVKNKVSVLGVNFQVSPKTGKLTNLKLIMGSGRENKPIIYLLLEPSKKGKNYVYIKEAQIIKPKMIKGKKIKEILLREYTYAPKTLNKNVFPYQKISVDAKKLREIIREVSGYSSKELDNLLKLGRTQYTILGREIVKPKGFKIDLKKSILTGKKLKVGVKEAKIKKIYEQLYRGRRIITEPITIQEGKAGVISGKLKRILKLKAPEVTTKVAVTPKIIKPKTVTKVKSSFVKAVEESTKAGSIIFGKEKLREKAREKVKVKEVPAEKLYKKAKEKIVTRVIPKTKLKVKSILKPAEKVKPMEEVKLIEEVKPITKVISVPKVKEGLKIKAPTKLITIKPTPIQPILTITTKPKITLLPPPLLPKTKFTKKIKEVEKEKRKKYISYIVELKRRGKWKPISPPLTKPKAYAYGLRAARKTLAATFKLRPVRLKPEKVKIKLPTAREIAMFRKYRIKKRKKIPTKLTWIQKREYRLGTKEEVREIQEARKKSEKIKLKYKPIPIKVR